MKWTWIITVIIMGWTSATLSESDQEKKARDFFGSLDKEMTYWLNRVANANWDYQADMKDSNLQKQLKINADYSAWLKKQWSKVIKFSWQNFTDPVLRRQFMKLSILGPAALPEDEISRFDKLLADMQTKYSTTTLYKWDASKSVEENIKEPSGQQTVNLEPDLITIFESEKDDACKLQYYWLAWHESVGRKISPSYREYVNLTREIAKLNNFPDYAAMRIGVYEVKDFETIIHKLYLQIRPLYEHLHAYVRGKLRLFFNQKKCVLIEEDGPLPAHILGNVWAQEWHALYDLTIPYSEKTSLDVTPVMRAMNYTPLKMFKTTEEFYTSLGLSPMTETFWKKSIIEKPKDRDIVCHPTAWDFFTGEDFRIKMCTNVDFTDFKTIHHEMGHIQYYQQYKDQPQVFRDGANEGFHEAVGDTLALSVSTPDHLIKIDLLDNKTYKDDHKADINSLYFMALDKVSFLPYAYILDLWRWEVFRGNTTLDKCNCRFWKLREEIQGIIPPVDRSAKDLDAAAKFHVTSDITYIRYFVSFIIQFQFHKALCIKAGQYNPKDPASKPLHRCDIYRSTEAGNALSSMLKLGSSKHWHYAMEALTGQQDMDAGPLLEYFQPLMDWLVKENKKNGEKIGWKFTNKVDYCKSWASGRILGVDRGFNFLLLVLFYCIL